MNLPEPVGTIHALATYDFADATQLSASTRNDIVPTDDDSRECLARNAMMQAVIYGLPSVYQYASMCSGSAPKMPGGSWILNTLVHDREVAGPSYNAFRVPNVDTLYSNGWLDLTAGPVFIDLPDFGERYFTLQFLDAYSNVSNISKRTYPASPQQFMIVTTDWRGPDPAGVEVFRVATPIMWVLMRVQIFGHDDLSAVHRLQDAVVVRTDHSVDGQRSWPIIDQPSVETSWTKFLLALDTSLRINGVPLADRSHVRQLRVLGIGGVNVTDGQAPAYDPATARGAAQGFTDAMGLLTRTRPLLGDPIENGWTRVLDKGVHGSNFLARAVMNFVGLGANVIEENCSYNTYFDSTGGALDGTINSYEINLTDPPPAGAFWSITLYDMNGRLYAAPCGRHSVGVLDRDNDPDNDHTTVVISQAEPESGTWLPCPAGPFFIVLRMYEPMDRALSGDWAPPAVRRLIGR